MRLCVKTCQEPSPVTTQMHGSRAMGNGEPAKAACKASSNERPSLRIVEREGGAKSADSFGTAESFQRFFVGPGSQVALGQMVDKGHRKFLHKPRNCSARPGTSRKDSVASVSSAWVVKASVGRPAWRNL